MHGLTCTRGLTCSSSEIVVSCNGHHEVLHLCAAQRVGVSEKVQDGQLTLQKTSLEAQYLEEEVFSTLVDHELDGASVPVADVLCDFDGIRMQRVPHLQ